MKNSYAQKRDLKKTPEPKTGEGRASKGDPVFVIQKHDASSLHYDFRIEVDGVLKSWAVPKGPSTDPREKRLAVPTEDHPLAYADFEGTIPKDQYGGGTVIVWDRGTYRNVTTKDDREVPIAKALDHGHAVIELDGEKLSGGYALQRMGKKSKDAQWLLVKTDDDAADARRKPTSTEPESVISGKTNDELEETTKEDDR